MRTSTSHAVSGVAQPSVTGQDNAAATREGNCCGAGLLYYHLRSPQLGTGHVRSSSPTALTSVVLHPA